MYQLCREWRSPDTALGLAVAEVWCELDPIPGAETIDLAGLAPSVFVVLKPLEAGERMAAIGRALEGLVGPDSAEPMPRGGRRAVPPRLRRGPGSATSG